MFRCPTCKRPTLCRVVDTYSAEPDYERMRKRECRACLTRFVTREAADAGAVYVHKLTRFRAVTS